MARKHLQLAGKIAIWSNEGGFCSSTVMINGHDIADEIADVLEKIYLEDVTDKGEQDGIYRLTLELL